MLYFHQKYSCLGSNWKVVLQSQCFLFVAITDWILCSAHFVLHKWCKVALNWLENFPSTRELCQWQLTEAAPAPVPPPPKKKSRRGCSGDIPGQGHGWDGEERGMVEQSVDILLLPLVLTCPGARWSSVTESRSAPSSPLTHPNAESRAKFFPMEFSSGDLVCTLVLIQERQKGKFSFCVVQYPGGEVNLGASCCQTWPHQIKVVPAIQTKLPSLRTLLLWSDSSDSNERVYFSSLKS